ncbi:MAG: COX15/CtaA family protein [Ilumatobacteraceae bacterium]
MRPRLTIPLHRFRQVAIVTVVGLCILVVAGGIVRLTGSGLGCDDWPSCNSESFVDVSSGHTAIEQINRLLSGVIGVPTLILIVGAFRVWPRRRGLIGPAVGVLATVFGNAIVGGLAVRGDLHPALVQSHFVLAIVSITFGMVAVHRSNPEPPGTPPDGSSRSMSIRFFAVGALTALALVTGTVVTGTGPHAGDEAARRWGFDISRVAQIHSIAVWIAIAAFVVLLVALRRRRGEFDRLATVLSTWMFVALVQGGIGYVQYFNGVPEVLVGAHLAGATALWVTTVHLIQVGVAPIGAESAAPGAGDDASETGDERQIPTPGAVRA